MTKLDNNNACENCSILEEDLTNLTDYELNLLIDKRANALAKFGLRVLHNGAELVSSLHRLHEELDRRHRVRFSRQVNLIDDVISENKRKWEGDDDDLELSKTKLINLAGLTRCLTLNKYPLKYLGKRLISD